MANGTAHYAEKVGDTQQIRWRKISLHGKEDEHCQAIPFAFTDVMKDINQITHKRGNRHFQETTIALRYHDGKLLNMVSLWRSPFGPNVTSTSSSHFTSLRPVPIGVTHISLRYKNTIEGTGEKNKQTNKCLGLNQVQKGSYATLHFR